MAGAVKVVPIVKMAEGLLYYFSSMFSDLAVFCVKEHYRLDTDFHGILVLLQG